MKAATLVAAATFLTATLAVSNAVEAPTSSIAYVNAGRSCVMQRTGEAKKLSVQNVGNALEDNDIITCGNAHPKEIGVGLLINGVRHDVYVNGKFYVVRLHASAVDQLDFGGLEAFLIQNPKSLDHVTVASSQTSSHNMMSMRSSPQSRARTVLASMNLALINAGTPHYVDYVDWGVKPAMPPPIATTTPGGPEPMVSARPSP